MAVEWRALGLELYSRMLLRKGVRMRIYVGQEGVPAIGDCVADPGRLARDGISRDCLKVMAPSFNAGSGTTGLRKDIREARS